MSEHHIETSHLDPLLEKLDNLQPSYDEQKRFFKQAFDTEPSKRMPLQAGPYYQTVAAYLARTQQELSAIDPQMVPEFLMSPAYQSRETQRAFNQLPSDILKQLIRVKYGHERRLHELNESHIVPALLHQEMPMGLLSTPPFHYQREDWSGSEAKAACANACFRMVFGAITGWQPSERAVATELIQRYSTSIVDDDVYSAVFQTEVFAQICPKKVSCRLIIGADFNYIVKRVKHLKSKLPEADVYCIVTLASENALDTLHTNVLLGRNNKGIVCHDPSPVKGEERRVLRPELFFKRWATAYTKAQLVIAV